MWYEHKSNVCNKVINYHLLSGFKNFSTGSIKMRTARFVDDVKLLRVTRAWCTIRLRIGLEETGRTPESEGGREGKRAWSLFQGGAENETRSPTVVPKYGEINKLLKLKSSVSLLPSPSRVPLSAGIKDPHKFHSARPSTLARARTSVGSLHPRRRNAPARASGIASSWHPFEPEKFRKKKRNYTLSASLSPCHLPPFSRHHARENARDIRPSDKRHNVIYGGYVATTGKKRSRSAVTRLSTRFPTLN